MSNAIGRFLTFEETLGKGLVKFAYYVLLAALALTTLAVMIGAIGIMIDGDVWEGIGTFILAPIRLAIAVIVLRVLAELVLAILSIDDHLRPEGRRDAEMPALRSGTKDKEPHQTAPFAAGGGSEGSGLTKTSLPHGDTEASRQENRRAPFADDAVKPKEGLTKTSLPHGDTEAGHPANEKAPFADERREGQTAGTQTGSAAKDEDKGTSRSALPAGSAASSGGSAKRADLKSSAEPSTTEDTAPKPARKTARKTTKKSTKKTASSTKKTISAANSSPASARSGEPEKKNEDKPGGGSSS